MAYYGHHFDDAADAVVLGKGKGTTLNFDDVDTSAYSGAAFMPSNYGGLTWSGDWVVADTKDWYGTSPYTNSGWYHGVTSGDQIAWNNGGVPVEISAKSFNLDSFELTAAWDKKMTVEIVASKGGEVVYDETFTVGDKKPMHIDLGLKGIDDITFTPTEVKVDPKAGGGSGSFMVIDDMVVSKVKSLAAPVDDHKLAAAFNTGSHTDTAHLASAHADLAAHHLAIA